MTGSLAVLMLVVAGCSPSADEEGELTVFAAASLRDVLAELEVAWLKEHPAMGLTIVTEASNVVAAQIAEGAPADAFVSADTARPRELVEDGHAAGEPVLFAHNRVVVVTPAGSGAVSGPADLAAPDVRIVAINEGAPISRYADEALAQLAATMPDPGAFAASIAANTVSREDNVRAALAKIELGEGDAAIVYRTDAVSGEGVETIPFPDAVDVIADYAAVAVSDRAAASMFVDWLGSPDAIEVIEAAGFEAPAR